MYLSRLENLQVQVPAGRSKNSRSQKSLLSTSCMPCTHSLGDVQWAHTITEISWLEFPTAPFTSFKIKAQEMTLCFSPRRLCDSRLRT